MAVPQRRVSKTRKRLRRTHFKLSAKGLITCAHCGEMIQPHRVCPFCGYYNGKPVVVKKTKGAKEAPVTKAKKTNKIDEKKTEEKK